MKQVISRKEAVKLLRSDIWGKWEAHAIVSHLEQCERLKDREVIVDLDDIRKKYTRWGSIQAAINNVPDFLSDYTVVHHSILDKIIIKEKS